MRATRAGLLLVGIAVALLARETAQAQAPAQAAAKMITCKDSTKVKDGAGACSGHGGKVKTPSASKAAAKSPDSTATKKKKKAAPKPDSTKAPKKP